MSLTLPAATSSRHDGCEFPMSPAAQWQRRFATSVNGSNSTILLPEPAAEGAQSTHAIQNIRDLLAHIAPACVADATDWVGHLALIRLAVLQTALLESIPYPGKIRDDHTAMMIDPWEPTHSIHGSVAPNCQCIRLGWRRLQEYFEVACPGFLNMKDPSHRRGILYWKQRVPVPGSSEGVFWSGIFATWVYRQTQRQWTERPRRRLRWIDSQMTLPCRSAADLLPGDIAALRGDHHHAILIAPASHGQVWVVSGDDDQQSIRVRSVECADIVYAHRADDIFI